MMTAARRLTLISRNELEQPLETPNPSRIALARKRRGLNQTAFARKLGVIRRAVVAYESGEYSPSEDTFRQMQSLLQFPREFFFGEDIEEPDVETGSFRSMKAMTAAQRDMALSQVAIGMHFSDWLDRRFDLPHADLLDLARESDPETAADHVRRAWGLGVMSIRNMIHLLEVKGVRVFSLAVDAREVDAFSMWRGGTPFVFLNTNKTAEHSRFDAAHELGHLVLHKHGSPRGQEAERQANRFASAFLMPSASVTAHRPMFPTYEKIVKIKKTWATSVSAVAYRLHELRLITDWQYRGIVIEVAKRGRCNEPEESTRETSLMLSKALKALYQDGLTRPRIAQELAVPTSELEQLLFGLTLTGLDGGRGESASPSKIQLTRVK
jgi:Zn-dependent peptidase ImmA (M78 family)/DNA-binding XRE family transcriptional regulator